MIADKIKAGDVHSALEIMGRSESDSRFSGDQRENLQILKLQP